MIKIFPTIAVSALLLQTAWAAVQSLPYEDHFAYSEGNLYTVAAGIWDEGGGTGVEIMVTNPAALTAPPGFPAASGKGVRLAPSGSARRNVMQFTSVTNTDGNAVYASFLVNVQTPPSAAKLIAYFENGNSSQSSPQLGVFVDNNANIGVGKKASSPGFKHVLIRPRPGGGLTHARASYRSAHGPIVTDWKLADRTFTMKLEIPANTTATVTLPGGNASEGGKPIAVANGITVTRTSTDETVLEIGSGRYQFSSTLPSR